MTENNNVDPNTLELARELVKQLEAGNQDEADNILTELTDMRESALFMELGKLTRDFHEAINAFNSDDRMISMAEEEIPDQKIPCSLRFLEKNQYELFGDYYAI